MKSWAAQYKKKPPNQSFLFLRSVRPSVRPSVQKKMSYLAVQSTIYPHCPIIKGVTIFSTRFAASSTGIAISSILALTTVARYLYSAWSYRDLLIYTLISSFLELLTVKLVPMDYETEDVLAPGSPTASDSTFSWLSRSPSPFDSSIISVLVPQSLQNFLVLTKSQSRDIAALIPQSSTTMQSSFPQPAASVLESVLSQQLLCKHFYLNFWHLYFNL